MNIRYLPLLVAALGAAACTSETTEETKVEDQTVGDQNVEDKKVEEQKDDGKTIEVDGVPVRIMAAGYMDE